MHLHDSFFSAALAAAKPEDLRQEFLISGLFQPGEVRLHHWMTDRTVVGGIVPTDAPLPLPNPEALRATAFLQRREAGMINLGGPGTVRVDGADYTLQPLDALYVGRGAREVQFVSSDPLRPARFYLLSYPAHVTHPLRHVRFSEVKGQPLGHPAGCNERTLHKLIDPAVFPTCQVVMGITRLRPGGVWNTMPPHTHLRRSEVYLYFDLPANEAVFHFMGPPTATRHLVVRDSEAVLSPPGSIHAGVGTGAYSFVWGMGGENQDFADMDPAPLAELR